MLFLLVFSLVHGSAFSNTSIVVSAIINGKSAYSGQFPYIVSLRRRWNNDHLCGGTIINLNWILTAAHCLNNGISPHQVVAIAGTLNPSFYGEKRFISTIVPHPDYNSKTFVNDLALVKLSLPFYWSTVIRPVNVRSVRFDQEVVAAGWGYGSGLNLKWLTLRTTRYCWNSWAFVCTKVRQAGVCSGDSGGPLVSTNNNLVGIVSNGDKAGCVTGKAQLFTKVELYKPWINYAILVVKYL